MTKLIDRETFLMKEACVLLFLLGILLFAISTYANELTGENIWTATVGPVLDYSDGKPAWSDEIKPKKYCLTHTEDKPIFWVHDVINDINYMTDDRDAMRKIFLSITEIGNSFVFQITGPTA